MRPVNTTTKNNDNLLQISKSILFKAAVSIFIFPLPPHPLLRLLLDYAFLIGYATDC